MSATSVVVSRIAANPPVTPETPSSPVDVLKQGMGQVMGAIESVNEGIAGTTNSIAQALPSFPAATIGMLSLGIPHGHTHPPSLIPPAPPVPLPVLGPIALGCTVQVLINGMPAARVGDIGFNPTCCGIAPTFEIFTGSSKVFIAGMRAARIMDVTMHCWPPKEFGTRGAVMALIKAAQVAMMAQMVIGTGEQLGTIAGELSVAATSQGAMASARGLAGAMAAAQMAADAAAMAVGALMGKDPAVGSPIGALTMGHPNVLIGGFPMPSGMQIAGRIMAGARRRGSKGGRAGSG